MDGCSDVSGHFYFEYKGSDIDECEKYHDDNRWWNGSMVNILLSSQSCKNKVGKGKVILENW